MPTVKDENGDVSVVYEMSQELKDLIDYKFAKTMIEEVENRFDYARENSNELIGVLCMNEVSSGVYRAFKTTCEKFNLNQLLEESNLDWYDYDMFIYEVCDTVGQVFFGKDNYEKLVDNFINEHNKTAEIYENEDD